MKVSLEIDTKEKSMSVKVDGITLSDVTDFTAYVNEYNDNKVSFYIHQSKTDDNSKTRETRILSSAKEVYGKQSDVHADLRELPSPKQIRDDIASLISKKLHSK